MSLLGDLFVSILCPTPVTSGIICPMPIMLKHLAGKEFAKNPNASVIEIVKKDSECFRKILDGLPSLRDAFFDDDKDVCMIVRSPSAVTFSALSVEETGGVVGDVGYRFFRNGDSERID